MKKAIAILIGIVGLVCAFGADTKTLTELDSFKIENQGLKHQNAQLSLQVLDLQKKLAEANEQLVKQADAQVVADYNKAITSICEGANLKADNCKINSEGADPTNADPKKRTFGKIEAKDKK